MVRLGFVFICAALAACSATAPAAPAGPVSGITSSSGGGERALHNQPNIGVTTRVGS